MVQSPNCLKSFDGEPIPSMPLAQSMAPPTIPPMVSSTA